MDIFFVIIIIIIIIIEQNYNFKFHRWFIVQGSRTCYFMNIV